MSDGDLANWLKLLAAVTALLTVALPTFYVTVLRPLLGQIKELIEALDHNTTATNTSASALTTTATAVQANTVATNAVAQAIPTAPVTINMPQPTGDVTGR